MVIFRSASCAGSLSIITGTRLFYYYSIPSRLGPQWYPCPSTASPCDNTSKHDTSSLRMLVEVDQALQSISCTYIFAESGVSHCGETDMVSQPNSTITSVSWFGVEKTAAQLFRAGLSLIHFCRADFFQFQKFLMWYHTQ